MTRPESRASCPSALSSTVFSWMSSAAAMSSPRASSTAPAMPAARGGEHDGRRRHAQRKQREHDEMRERPEDALAEHVRAGPGLPRARER